MGFQVGAETVFQGSALTRQAVNALPQVFSGAARTLYCVLYRPVSMRLLEALNSSLANGCGSGVAG